MKCKQVHASGCGCKTVPGPGAKANRRLSEGRMGMGARSLHSSVFYSALRGWCIMHDRVRCKDNAAGDTLPAILTQAIMVVSHY
jgi:hypothetical protein